MEVQTTYYTFTNNIDIGRVLFLPGVSDKVSFLLQCQGCNACQAACPAECITYLELEPGAKVPFIEPLKEPCIMCSDLPCSQACPNEALLIAPWSEIKMGIALLDPSKCLCIEGEECHLCVDAIPKNCSAISWDREVKAPLIDINSCSGCGVCASVCPAKEKAITILPL